MKSLRMDFHQSHQKLAMQKLSQNLNGRITGIVGNLLDIIVNETIGR